MGGDVPGRGVGRAYDVITFDCYGTLIDWESGIARAFAEAGVGVPRAEILALYADFEPEAERQWKPYREVLAEVARRVGARLGVDVGDGTWLGRSLPSWKPFPDTNAALERLAAAGYRLAVLSNVDDDLFAGTRAQLTAPLEFVVTAGQVKAYKPASAHWDAARPQVAGRRWLHAAQSWFHDVVPARAMGLDAAWVNRKAEAATGGTKPTFEVADLAGLAETLAP